MRCGEEPRVDHLVQSYRPVPSGISLAEIEARAEHVAIGSEPAAGDAPLPEVEEALRKGELVIVDLVNAKESEAKTSHNDASAHAALAAPSSRPSPDSINITRLIFMAPAPKTAIPRPAAHHARQLFPRIAAVHGARE